MSRIAWPKAVVMFYIVAAVAVAMSMTSHIHDENGFTTSFFLPSLLHCSASTLFITPLGSQMSGDFSVASLHIRGVDLMAAFEQMNQRLLAAELAAAQSTYSSARCRQISRKQ
jgi:hypothetical protein